ncbi:MAG TPA: hypothetical protein PL018_02430 [Ignavibacteriaceae bacterium]|nr:hypothetical protein [Ignavibacteriaceae bacterium]
MEQENKSLFNISASYKFGSSGKDDEVKYHSFQLGAAYNVLEKTSFQLSIPYNIQSGPLGEVNGIGDLIFSATQNIYSDESSSLATSIGAKLATGDDNKKANLPTAYQSGLGSNDVLLALNYSYNDIGLGIGYQLAGGRNKNTLTKLKRGDDLLLRASYNFSFDGFRIMPQLLFIKRFGESSILDTAYIGAMETYIDVANSDQTQLNFLTTFQYQINNNYSLVADFAFPFLKREVNVDGLTRAFSVSVGVVFIVD